MDTKVIASQTDYPQLIRDVSITVCDVPTKGYRRSRSNNWYQSQVPLKDPIFGGVYEISSSGIERESFWRSPLLKQGEYDLWALEMATHVRSIDDVCWKIITEGYLTILDAKDEPLTFNLYTKDDYKKDERTIRP